MFHAVASFAHVHLILTSFCILFLTFTFVPILFLQHPAVSTTFLPRTSRPLSRVWVWMKCTAWLEAWIGDQLPRGVDRLYKHFPKGMKAKKTEMDIINYEFWWIQSSDPFIHCRFMRVKSCNIGNQWIIMQHAINSLVSNFSAKIDDWKS